MRAWRDTFGVIFIGAYLVFFSVSWAKALAGTPKTAQSQQVLSAQSSTLSHTANLPDPNQLLGLTNQARGISGQPPLLPHKTLIALAQRRANDMATRHYYAHLSPENTYYYDSLRTTEFKDVYSCENLGMGSSIGANFYVSQWALSDKGHKECLLDERVTYVGYGIAELPFDPERSDTQTYIVVAIHSAGSKY